MSNSAAPACPLAGAIGRARQAGAAEFTGRLYRPNRPCPSLALSGNRTDQSATGRLLRRSSDTRFSRAVRASRGESLWLHAQRPSLPFRFLPDLTRVKFGSACPPLGRRYRAHPPGHALPNFQPIVSPHPPLPFAYALGPSDRSICHCQIAQRVLWLPAFAGGVGVKGGRS